MILFLLCPPTPCDLGGVEYFKNLADSPRWHRDNLTHFYTHLTTVHTETTLPVSNLHLVPVPTGTT